MTDLDQSGRGFQRVRTYLGPSLGWTDELVQPTVEITTAGAYTVKPGDSLILVNVAASVTINLPDVIKWVQQTANQPATGFGRSITVKDFGGNAQNFNIVIAPLGSQSIDNIQQAILIDQARAVVELVPLIDLSGWAIASVSTAGGGGGGGDVFKAGNNTYTGINIFTNTTLAVTESPADNSLKVATTAFVKSQNYIDASALASYAPINNPTLTGDPKAPTPSPGDNDTSIATTAFVQQALNGFQPLDPDLTSIAGQTLTGTFFYRFADGNWQPVVIGGGLSFIGGTLASSAGGGNVSSVGTPTNGQIAQWTSSTQIQGVDGSTLGFQPLDGDLTAIAALTGTNTIYYRSATNIWSPVTFSGLSFSGGILTVTVGGGNVTNVATPVAGQVAEWTDATHIQGVSTYAKLASPIFTGVPAAPTAAAGTNTTQLATTAFVNTAMAGVVQVGFRGHKGGVSQTGIPNNTPTKVTFSTEAYDLGSYYDTTLSRWTPPAGLVHLDGTVYLTGVTAGVQNVLYIYKNGAPIAFASASFVTASTSDGFVISIDDQASGTDYYELWLVLFTGGTGSIAGGSFFNGHVTGGPQGPAGQPGSVTVSGTLPTQPQGRLTLASNTPVMVATVTGATTIYYTSYVGNLVPIYNGTSFDMMGFGTELSVATTDTTKSPAAIGVSKINDWFVWSDGGTLRLGHGPDWTSDTARSAGTALVKVNGIWLNNVSITNGPAAQRGTYVGTTKSGSTSQLIWQLGGAAVFGLPPILAVWNCYNRVDVRAFSRDTTASWTDTTGTWKQLNASGQNAVYAVFGLEEDGYEICLTVEAQGTVGTANANIGISMDNFTGTPQQSIGFNQQAFSVLIARHIGTALGYHFWQAVQNSSGSTAAFYGGSMEGLSIHARM